VNIGGVGTHDRGKNTPFDCERLFREMKIAQLAGEIYRE
jgi:hypothetical protein